jgi:DMSO/TMAO reductase YedYZ molybdopterin-dependent catalytic subunit
MAIEDLSNLLNKGRENRRQFLKAGALTFAGLALPAGWLFGKPGARPAAGQVPAAARPAGGFPGKHPDLVVLSDKPWNIETPAHLLDDAITPADKLFVRNNGLMPEAPDAAQWTLTIDGESVARPLTFTIRELQQKFKTHTYQLVHECAGNGRAEFSPPGNGNQWTTGGVGCCEWTGVRLRDVLQAAGLKPDAVYIGYYGRDKHLSGKAEVPISRGVPLRKALEDEALIAWAMNGQDIPLAHGYPLRLIFGGWPASTSGKWLTRIAVRNIVHDGPKMNGADYRLPIHPIAPGTRTQLDNAHMRIIEAMPVKSLITYPKTGAQLAPGQPLALRGHAWAGDRKVKAVDVSFDFGATWQKCALTKPRNRNCWQHWQTAVKLPGPGYYEIFVRATDDAGVMQPMLVPAWNPGGYLNNACHRIAVAVA